MAGATCGAGYEFEYPFGIPSFFQEILHLIYIYMIQDKLLVVQLLILYKALK